MRATTSLSGPAFPVETPVTQYVLADFNWKGLGPESGEEDSVVTLSESSTMGVEEENNSDGDGDGEWKEFEMREEMEAPPSPRS